MVLWLLNLTGELIWVIFKVASANRVRWYCEWEIFKQHEYRQESEKTKNQVGQQAVFIGDKGKQTRKMRSNSNTGGGWGIRGADAE